MLITNWKNNFWWRISIWYIAFK